MGPIAMSHPIVMVVMVMATARSQKAVPIPPIRCGRRRCIKPREVLLLETISKLRGAGLKPVASASRLVLAAKFLGEMHEASASARSTHANPNLGIGDVLLWLAQQVCRGGRNSRDPVRALSRID